ncbi:MAG: response regulator transcription factor [Opitutaceae bacterium]|nr:response regulator transcription factor [Opitutaceae bacterium]
MRVVIIEDEPLIAQRLERFAREILGERLESVRVGSTFEEASVWLADHPADVVLLDLNLHGRDGLKLLETAVAGSFHTIIVSANTDRALRAFELGVLDFVPKPFTRERLAHAFQRATTRDAQASCAARFLAVRKHGRIELVPIDQVLYVEGAGAYAELVLADGRRELHEKTLERVHALLPPVFERTHKSFVVRMTAVKALHAGEGSHYELELKNGIRLPVGRQRYKELLALLVAGEPPARAGQTH